MDGGENTVGAGLNYSQESRLLRLKSPLGPDNVILTELRGEDAISAPFSVELTFVTTLGNAMVKRLLGQPVTAMFGSPPDRDQRPISGLVRHLSGPAPGPRGFKVWRARVVPQLAFLDLTQDCRIFQQQSVLDILRTVFAAHGLDLFEFRGLMGQYPALDYCVQYRETALAFVNRLMEQAGLFYWHEFSGETHTLVITDSNLAAPAALHEPVKLPAESGFFDVETLTNDYDFRSGKWTLTDYDFTAPTKMLTSDTPTVLTEPPMMQYEVFDFPGQYFEPEDGATRTRHRIEHEEMRFHTLSGTGRRAVFDAGRTLALEPGDAEALDVKGKLLLTAVWYEAADWSFVHQNTAQSFYRNRFEAIPAERQYRPAQKTPKPVVKGVQCAVVVGPPGEYIHTDHHGRVKVRFFWDRNPFHNPDENRSCWLRVSQSWADGKFGGVHLPRVGQEVLVDFLEGDPDRPIVSGRVYNGDNMHPYDLPANKTQSGFKTQSVPPNGGWNEMRIEDIAGSELLYMRSQKDHAHDILNDHRHKVGHNHNHSVGNDYNITISNDYNINVTNNITTTTPATTSSTATSAFDAAVTKMGAYHFAFTAAGVNIAIYGLYIQMPTMVVTLSPLKIDILGVKMDNSRVKIENEPSKFVTTGLKVKNNMTVVNTTGTIVHTVMDKIDSAVQVISGYETALFI